MSRTLQFINISHPTDSSSASLRQQVQSYAARERHARARRIRTAKHQSNRTKQEASTEQGAVAAADAGESRKDSGFATLRESKVNPKTSKLPSPLEILASGRKDPFGSIASTLLPIEHFLLDHYVKAVIPYMSLHCPIQKVLGRRQESMIREWVRLALTDIGFLSAIFLAACRHLSMYHLQQGKFVQLAIRYKLSCIHALNEAISAEVPHVSDSTVAKVMALAFDEIALHDLVMVRHHIRGAVLLVNIKGGPQTLGLNGFLKHMLHSLVNDKQLLSEDSGMPCGDYFMMRQLVL